MIGIVVSTADQASKSIEEQLLEGANWTRTAEGVYEFGDFVLREFDELHLELDEVANSFDDPEYIVVASKHSGETGPLLSAHFTGNFGDATYGGSPGELVEAAPGAAKRVIRELDTHAPDTYAVSMECTHHGPSDLGAPGLFVELGSGPEQWTDTAGARAVANAILELDGVDPDAERTVVAFGGNHYAPQPTRLLLETDVAVGHVAADWSLDALGDPESNRDIIDAMFVQSDTDMAVIDGEWPDVRSVIKSLGYRIVSETWIRETSGVGPELVKTLETALGPIQEGLRFGQERASDPVITSLPDELMDACAAIDPEKTVQSVDAHSVAYQTEENGNRVGDRAAFRDEAAFAALIDACVSLLETEYDDVTKTDEAIVAERDVFDPALARERGVPEGPLFGQLSAGQSITVDGETIEPEAVHTREISRFEV